MALTPDPAVLHGMDLFAGLDRDALTDIIRQARTRRIQKGTLIFAQGDEAATCHALIDGRVKIAQNVGEGQQVVMRFIGPGEMFGTLAVFMGGGYPADAVAVADCVEIHWSAASMTELMLRHPRIALNALGALGRRMRQMQKRMSELATQRVERRVAHALVRLVREAGRRTEDGVEIDFPISRQDLAEMTGTTLHTVSRILSAWEERGFVESGRQHIVIRRPHAVVAIAEDLPQPRAGGAPHDSLSERNHDRPEPP